MKAPFNNEIKHETLLPVNFFYEMLKKHSKTHVGNDVGTFNLYGPRNLCDIFLHNLSKGKMLEESKIFYTHFNTNIVEICEG